MSWGKHGENQVRMTLKRSWRSEGPDRTHGWTRQSCLGVQQWAGTGLSGWSQCWVGTLDPASFHGKPRCHLLHLTWVSPHLPSLSGGGEARKREKRVFLTKWEKECLTHPPAGRIYNWLDGPHRPSNFWWTLKCAGQWQSLESSEHPRTSPPGRAESQSPTEWSTNQAHLLLNVIMKDFFLFFFYSFLFFFFPKEYMAPSLNRQEC